MEDKALCHIPRQGCQENVFSMQSFPHPCNYVSFGSHPQSRLQRVLSLIFWCYAPCCISIH